MSPGRPPRLPLVLFLLLTAATFLGPLAFGFVLWGGPRPDWPPDRPVEWWALWGVSGLVVGLMAAAIGTSLAHRGRGNSQSGGGPPAEGRRMSP